MAGLGPKLPLILGTEDGTYQLIKTYKNLVSQNFKNLLLTSPGERMMDPHFGVGIRNFLFENDSEFLYSEISSEIDIQVRKYMPFIIVTDVLFVTPEMAGFAGMDNNFLSMQIEYTIAPLNTIDNLEITVPHN